MQKEREDILITRVVDDIASDADWNDLERIGAADPTVYRRLAETLRADRVLAAELGEEISAADSVDAPLGSVDLVDASSVESARRATRPALAVAGWIAALFFAAFWLAGINPLGSPAGTRLAIDGSADVELVGELPMMLVETSPAPSGDGYEILYVRRIVERTVIDSFYELGSNEYGEPVPVAINLASMVEPDRL